LFRLALSPIAEAVSPPPDGGYPGGNTAGGSSALLSLYYRRIQHGKRDIFASKLDRRQLLHGVGAGTLLANTADEITATGAGALSSNLVGTGNPADGAFALFKTLIARIEEQDARIQRVSNQIQISSSMAQVAVSNQ